MDISNLASYYNVIIVGICLCVGYILKNAIPSKKINRFIPLILGGLGLVLSIISNLKNLSLEVVLVGLFSGLLSTGLYETFKNLIKGEK